MEIEIEEPSLQNFDLLDFLQPFLNGIDEDISTEF